ncbi:helix-turn-helix transcriptional regulator [uncultured Thomasclavelia sp.]|uniref:helix-turn-helix domain-containing protein n=1 Tax=uncultured Thomasclavelia sp. TaxID=3025759 RepID=UPI0026206F62|nr:helix-turn-helix transcriptional regulator [uncultured Thomasclavelia sp.]
MTQGERVKEIRKELELSMEKFGESLGVTKSAISRIENGKSMLTDRMAKLICKEFNVDYFWLTEGTGNMFMQVPDSLIEEVIEDYNLDKNDKYILESYLELSDDEKKTIKNFFINIADKIKKDEG